MGTRPSSGGSSRRLQHHGSRGHLEVKRRASLPPDRDRRRHKPESTPGKQHWERGRCGLGRAGLRGEGKRASGGRPTLEREDMGAHPWLHPWGFKC